MLRPAASSASIMPAMKACEGSDGTLGVLARQTFPLAGSCSAMSVKVPPISTATVRAASDESIDLAPRRPREGGDP